VGVHTAAPCMLSEIFTGIIENFPSPLTEVAGSKFPMGQFCLITKLYSLLFQTTVMNIRIIMLRHKAINTYSYPVQSIRH